MQETDMQKFKEDYDSSPAPLKRIMVLELLGKLKDKGEIFNNFHEFIFHFPDDVTEPELDQIFRIILISIFTDMKEKTQESESKLHEMKETMKRMKKCEQEERNKEGLKEEFTSESIFP